MATILQLAYADRNISLFTKGLKQSGLDDKLTGIGPFTILAPVNLALGKLTSSNFEALLTPGNKNKLREFIAGYIFPGKKMSGDFRNNQKLVTLEGQPVNVSLKNGEIHLNGAKILSKDRQGTNGVVHLLDKTYMDPETIEK